MSKKIKSYEELLKKNKECEALIEARKKWTDIDLENTKIVKIGIGQPTPEAQKLADEVSISVIDYLKIHAIEDVAVIQSEFYGYSGNQPSLEIIIPKSGQIVFGNMTPDKAVKLVKEYILDAEKIKTILVDNDGNKKCDH